MWITRKTGRLAVLTESLGPSPAHALVLTSTFPNATPRENPKTLSRARQASDRRRKILYAGLRGDIGLPELVLTRSYSFRAGKKRPALNYQKVFHTF